LHVLLVGVLCAGPSFANPSILLFPSVGTTAVVTVRGRVLREAPSRGSSTLSKNVRLLTSDEWGGASVELRFGGRTASAVSNAEGDFEVAIPSGEGPFEVGEGQVEAITRGARSVSTLEVISEAAPYFVISDFDDTIAVTNVQQGTELLSSTFLKDRRTHPSVPGMAKWYQCLRHSSSERPAFALVSGSPLQFGERIREFLVRNGFPPFGLYLRNVGPATLRDYKQPVIRALLKALPHKVVLIGDSGERDPEVYAQIETEFPGRVLATYIHNVGRDQDPQRFRNMMLFSSASEAAADSVGRGLANAECVKAWLAQ
jgi:phosphatidate phosphatase APP1